MEAWATFKQLGNKLMSNKRIGDVFTVSDMLYSFQLGIVFTGLTFYGTLKLSWWLMNTRALKFSFNNTSVLLAK